MINISGKWYGQYTNGPEYGELEGRSVNFELVITMLEDGTFEGALQDVGEGAALSEIPSKISGFMEEDYISFFDVMGPKTELDVDGKRVPSQRLLTPNVHYYGNYDADTVSFYGEFEVEAEDDEPVDKNRILIWTGTWTMQRV